MILDYIKHTGWSKRNMVMAACVLIAMVALYNWFVTPHSQYLLAVEKYENAAEQVEKTAKTINAELWLHQRKLDKISEQFRQKRQEFFEVDDAGSFLGDIQTKAKKSGCFVDTLRFSPIKEIAVKNDNSVGIQQYQVNLTVSGQYQDIVKLLDSLQNRKQKVWIDTINLHLKDPSRGYLVCDLSLSIYALKVKEIQSHVNDGQ
jgi:hypothetical protein